MAELQVGIKADVSGAKQVTRALKDIKRAAGQTSGSLQAASASATRATVSLQGTAKTSLSLAGAQDLTAVANRAVARTLAAVSAQATATAAAESRATKATVALTAAMSTLSAVASAALAKAAAAATSLGARLGAAAGKTRSLGVAGTALGAAVAGGLAFGVKSAVDFELSMSRIIGLVGVAADEVAAFKKPLLDIAKATAKGPNELAEALFFITSAGLKGQDALDVLEQSAKAASAGLGETKQVADAVTSAMNAYGKENLSAAMATDTLVASVKEGKAEATEIAGAIGQVLPIATQLDVTFDQVGATIASLTRVGLNAAESATALKATLNALSKPGQDAVDTLESMSEANLGTKLSFDDVRKVLAEDGLIATLELLQEVTGGNTQALQKIFPNIRAGAGVFSLIGKNAGEVADIFERMAVETGQTDKAFDAFASTSAFTLKEALVAMQVSLQKIGEDLLPAVAKAFVALSSAVSGTVDVFTSLGAIIAESISGPDDPYIRAINRQRELSDAVADFQVQINRTTQFDPVTGKNIVKEIRRPLNELDKWIIKQTGINRAGVELTGTYEEQLQQLMDAAAAQDIIVNQMDSEAKTALDIARAERERADTLEETAEVVEEIVEKKIIDADDLAKGKKSLADLNAELSVLSTDLSNIATMGRQGIGLAEAGAEAAEIFADLQGEVAITEDEIVELIRQKQRLATAIEIVNEAFERQAAATDFLDDLAINTDQLLAKFDALSAGSTMLNIDTLQQAQQIFRDLGEETGGRTVESIQQELILQNALNEAIGAMPVNKFAELRTQVELLQQLNADPESSYFGTLGPQIQAVGDAAVDAVLKAEGLQGLDQILLEAMPKEEQFAMAHERLKAAFNLKGIVDPEQNPEFIAALDALEAKIMETGDGMDEFAKNAARGLQTAFADFLFDPFEDGLDGMLRNFADTLKRMAAEALAAAAIKAMIDALSNFGGGGNTGGFGGFLNALGGAFGGGMADGGSVQGGKTHLVGERGPELFTPGQSGNIVSNEMMRGAAAPAPQVNVAPAPVVVVDDPAKVPKALASAEGQRALVEAVTEKRGAIRQALGPG